MAWSLVSVLRVENKQRQPKEVDSSMGSLCCVAARPHGSNAASRDWSLGPHEPFGIQIRAFHHLHQDGISNSNLKGCHMVGMMLYNCMVHLHHQIVKKVEAGYGATIIFILTTLHLMVLGCFLVVLLTFHKALNGHLRQSRKSILMVMKLQPKGVLLLLLHHPFL